MKAISRHRFACATKNARRIARGISQHAAGEIARIAGGHSREIEAILGYSYGETVVHRDDLVVLESGGEGA